MVKITTAMTPEQRKKEKMMLERRIPTDSDTKKESHSYSELNLDLIYLRR